MSSREQHCVFSQPGEGFESAAGSSYCEKLYWSSRETGEYAAIDGVELLSQSRLPGEATRPGSTTSSNDAWSFCSKQHAGAVWLGRGKLPPSLQRAALFSHIA